MERCYNTEALNSYMEKVDKTDREFEFFMDDTEKIRNEIETLIMRMKEIGEDYENIDTDEETRNFVMDLIK